MDRNNTPKFYGLVFGTDSAGNFKVRPEGGGRTVVLSGSGYSSFIHGQRVEYQISLQGNHVDFSNQGSYRVARDQAGDTTEPNRKRLELEFIKQTLSNADTSDTSAIIIYDPSQKHYDISEYHFMSIARTRQRSNEVIAILYDWGFGGGGSFGIDWYQGNNGLYGKIHHVIRDFRQKIQGTPKQEGILFIPLEGIVDGDYQKLITMETLQVCVESANIPDLESRL